MRSIPEQHLHILRSAARVHMAVKNSSNDYSSIQGTHPGRADIIDPEREGSLSFRLTIYAPRSMQRLPSRGKASR